MADFFSDFRLYALVAFGIGLVIFVHELGHFLAARWCGVRVETFSLGFGPKVFGWKRGPTTYQLSLVPLGGYVKMAGEEVLPGRPAGSDELPAKSVGQRFLIFSGGVIMNVIFALIVFPIILMIGVPMSAPLVGDLAPGSPAWTAGIESGTRILSVNGSETRSFEDVAQAVALGSPERTELLVRRPGSTSSELVRLVPRYDEEMGIYAIGLGPARDAQGRLDVERGTPAAEAGLARGDRLLEVVGAPAALRVDQALIARMQTGEPVEVVVERSDGSRLEARIAPGKKELERRILGLSPVHQRVEALRPTPLVQATGLAADDRLLEVDGQRILRPFDLERALEAASADGRARMRVRRGEEVVELPEFALTAGDVGALARAIALAPDKESRVAVLEGSAAAQAGIVSGDRVVKVGDRTITLFQDILDANQAAPRDEALTVDVERSGSDGVERLTFAVTPRPAADYVYGLAVRGATEIFQASGPLDAARVGVGASWKFAVESWLTLKRILLGDVSSKNIGGIITIGVVSHSWASDGIAKLFFFLCILSMNLAFLNVLPIPVLDGGHLLFLLIEKLKGSPVSERVLAHSQMVGVVLIVSLMVYVTFNDVWRWFVR